MGLVTTGLLGMPCAQMTFSTLLWIALGDSDSHLYDMSFISRAIFRRELEFCDLPTTLLTTHAVGGGTGSGLGTKVTESLSDYFSECNLLNIAVTPYHFSEVVSYVNLK